MNRPRDTDLVPLDPEIERTFRARRREQQGATGMEERVEGAVVNNIVNNAAAMADDRDRAIRDYTVPMLHELQPGIIRLELQA